MTRTPQLALAAGQDAGNRSMQAAGRFAWSEEDWNAAAEVTNRLWPEELEESPIEMERRTR